MAADDDKTLAPFRSRSDAMVPRTVIPKPQSGQIEDPLDLQRETQQIDGPMVPASIRDGSANHTRSSYFQRKFYPPGWDD